MKTILVKFEKPTNINNLNMKLKDAKLREWAIFTELFIGDEINFELTINSKAFINTLNLIHDVEKAIDDNVIKAFYKSKCRVSFEVAYKQFWDVDDKLIINSKLAKKVNF